MTPAEFTRTLDALTGRYLASPDPVAWMAAADLIEEECGGESCRRSGDAPCLCHFVAAGWRRRAKWLNPILDAYGFRPFGDKWAERAPHGQSTEITLHESSENYGRVRLVFSRNKRTTLVFLQVDVGHDECPYVNDMWRHTTLDQNRYLTRRAVQLIDYLGEARILP